MDSLVSGTFLELAGGGVVKPTPVEALASTALFDLRGASPDESTVVQLLSPPRNPIHRQNLKSPRTNE